ncbi:GNAT family N-acetyltransferase [Flavobacteriaceae bacterium XHP0103]|uniref:GNAT family N-acetyltransferase n=1 Tax=Marixanthotalea marina TaxID=2844359 RepID=UPI002989CA35|nr:GNAT family N-acetyltransferase [Marixanthotalea marina]MBU3822664.1 GNAT family N-acetyltransferase [Marixanthotalea marina]
MVFKETIQYNQFFNILPLDWQETILPVWNNYKDTTKCYLLLDNEKPIAGGLVFYECPPDMLYAKEEAKVWFSKGYLYLGFVYVLQERRGQNLGSLWLSKLKDKFPQQKYWLTIEDLDLHSFYVKNGFKKIKELNDQGQKEVLYALEP